MKSEYKAIHKEAAPILIDQLKAGTSVFQKPLDKDNPAFVWPVNAVTNKRYQDINAFWIGIQGHKDPRVMTFSQATYAKIKINKGAEGTRMNYLKNSDIEAIRDPEGKKILNDDGSTKTKTTVFEKPKMADTKVFNAEQLTGLPSLEDYLKDQPIEKLSPVERLDKLIKESGAVVELDMDQAFYDKTNDIIHMPPKEAFENEEKYLAAAIHQLAHWTGHESRLSRNMEGRFGSIEYAHEEMRAAIAAMMIGAELKIGTQFGQHAVYANHFANILKDNPYQITKATRDGQRAFDYVMGIGQKRELDQNQQQGKPAAQSQTLKKGEVIAYNNTKFEVLEKKSKKMEMTDLSDGRKFSMTTGDELFKKLVEARNNPVVQGQQLEREPEMELEEENTYSMKR